MILNKILKVKLIINDNGKRKTLPFSKPSLYSLRVSSCSQNPKSFQRNTSMANILKHPLEDPPSLSSSAAGELLFISSQEEDEEFSYKKELNKVVSIFQNIEKNQETSQVQTQLENSTKYNISKFSQNTTNAKKPGNRNITCINSISSNSSNNFKLGGLNITINDEDEDKFSLPFSGKTIKAIV